MKTPVTVPACELQIALLGLRFRLEEWPADSGTRDIYLAAYLALEHALMKATGAFSDGFREGDFLQIHPPAKQTRPDLFECFQRRTTRLFDLYVSRRARGICRGIDDRPGTPL